MSDFDLDDANKLLEALEKFKRLISTPGSAKKSSTESVNSDAPDSRVESESRLPQLKLALDEERRTCDRITDDFNQLRAKVLAFITGELALITLLFATGMKVPHVVYGVFFFLFGVLCISVSFVILLWLLKGILWARPAHPQALKAAESFESEENFTRYLCESYSSCNEVNTGRHTQRVRLFDISLTLLFVGVIILLVIKFGQGSIEWQNIIQK